MRLIIALLLIIVIVACIDSKKAARKRGVFIHNFLDVFFVIFFCFHSIFYVFIQCLCFHYILSVTVNNRTHSRVKSKNQKSDGLNIGVYDELRSTMLADGKRVSKDKSLTDIYKEQVKSKANRNRFGLGKHPLMPNDLDFDIPHPH